MNERKWRRMEREKCQGKGREKDVNVKSKDGGEGSLRGSGGEE